MGDASLGAIGRDIEVDLAQTWRAANIAAYHDYVDDTIVFGDRTAYLLRMLMILSSYLLVMKLMTARGKSNVLIDTFLVVSKQQ